MGMFDYVIPATPIKCPGCKIDLVSFQTKDLVNMMDVYEEGKSKTRVYARRKMTKVEAEAEKKKYPSLADAGLLFFYTTDKKKYTIKGYPTYTSIYAYEFCSKCDKMVGQNFRFNSKGVLKRYGKPTEE